LFFFEQQRRDKKKSIQDSIFHDEKDIAQAIILLCIVSLREKEASGGCSVDKNKDIIILLYRNVVQSYNLSVKKRLVYNTRR
jgi:hypothetical protein